ncbi:putative RNA recognition motif domain, nucleotide-binding alpha-beta plait domain superfamily [Helianthus anomalus]
MGYLLYAVRITCYKDSGRSRGFGFVNFSSEDKARSAKDAMNGKVCKYPFTKKTKILKCVLACNHMVY